MFEDREAQGRGVSVGNSRWAKSSMDCMVVFFLHCPLSTFLPGLGMILGASRAGFQMMPGLST